MAQHLTSHRCCPDQNVVVCSTWGHCNQESFRNPSAGQKDTHNADRVLWEQERHLNVPEKFYWNWGPSSRVNIHFQSAVTPSVLRIGGPYASWGSVSEFYLCACLSGSSPLKTINFRSSPANQWLLFSDFAGLLAVDSWALTPPYTCLQAGTCVDLSQSTDHQSLCSTTISWLWCHTVLPGRRSPPFTWAHEDVASIPTLWQWLRNRCEACHLLSVRSWQE